jgi:Fe-S cluster assembly protein SufD
MNFSDSARLQLNDRLTQAQGPEKAFRERAWAEFERLGWPDRKDEAWKYTSLTSLGKTAWPQSDAATGELPEKARELLKLHKADFDMIVLLNGQLQPKYSQLTLESGYELTRCKGVDELDYEDGFFSMSAALNRGGYELRVAEGVKFPKPLLIIHCQQGEGTWTPTLNRVTLERGSRFELAEIFMGESTAYLRTDITHVRVAQDADLTWVRVQEEGAGASYFAEVQSHLAEKACLSLTQVNCGAAWARSSLKVNIEGELAEAHLNGLSFGRGQQHVDQRVRVQHLAGRSVSSQLFKGILKDRARGVLNGKIYIARNAQKVSSSQLNHNLLLSPGAEADTKPELEIYADDVKANHGASVGRLDEEKLFYLLSRGIPRNQAQTMLARAFADDVLMKVSDPLLRGLLMERVASLLPDFIRQMEIIE